MTSTNLPESLDELERRITQQYNKLSKRLKQVARYLLDHPRDAALETVATIAQKAEVTPSALIRFANAFGFQGFSEMQMLFRNKLVDASPNYNERIRLANKDLSQNNNPTTHQLLREFSSANIIALDHLSEEIDDKTLSKAVDFLHNAAAIHIMGVRRSFVVASYFAYAMRHIDRRAYLLDGIGGMYTEQAHSIEPNDAMIAISFTPYAKETLEIADIALRKGTPLIAITDSPLSPLALQANVCLVVKEAQVRNFRSLTTSLCLAQALSIGLAFRQEQD
jgi:DNA-binding MurR/RpiR family transcriptional regulator